MAVRREITMPRCETVRQAHRSEQALRTGAQSPENPKRTVQDVEDSRSESAGRRHLEAAGRRL